MQDQIIHNLPAIHGPSLFQSFFQASFDCSTEWRGDGRRLDIIHSSGHEMLAAKDYAQLADCRLTTVRDGLRWHLIETTPGQYDWSSFLPMLHSAQANGLQVIWDLCHFGWPDHLDIWQPAFVDGFARFAGAAAALGRAEGVVQPIYTPINAVSFWSWAGGDMASIAPMASGQGKALKQQLVRASLAAMAALRAVDPTTRFLQPEPVVHINAPAGKPELEQAAEALRLRQFEVWDMLCGREMPALGGGEEWLDIIGVGYRPGNQWFYHGETIALDDGHYRPFATILQEVWQRYQRPLLIDETGAEEKMRVPWARYIFEQAVQAHVAVEGICHYPIADYRSWSEEKHRPFGLLGMQDVNGCRSIYEPLALELRDQQIRLAGLLKDAEPGNQAVSA
ncbi:beta-glucosidase/6-phospho-beta- glucosidase/beta- galactosidase [Candidatus Sodalis pierantonius str. SOPE]|uniref:Beta-glucosidase/6-phospho-beta-glucosidase/beta-galactosidase n=1 Tax=Candidatus Sodalis pierantonii str. SOPE TaxID=2342 RepID=W0HIS5_9GAMM|nr:beta-glucosidase [Candidatus Sodalis pierantonius]AHF73654.1 beta-glucosidase/6-phospho-beta- glucosidase/beta- galactosidase [Candidatus Sodalis pierantonius str. SOPE]